MPSPCPHPCRRGFTLVEVLLATALTALIATILALLAHALLSAGDAQAGRLRGPFAARAALRSLSRDLSCAFSPPMEQVVPLKLSTSTEPDQPETSLLLYVPVPEPSLPLGYDIHQVTYEVHRSGKAARELRRMAAPCSGPGTNTPMTRILLRGPFAFSMQAVSDASSHDSWPPPNEEDPELPTSMTVNLTWDQRESYQTEVLIQPTIRIRSPIERASSGERGPED